MTWQDKVLTLVIGRLQDKSSQVRKNSIQLVTAFIKCNPFAAKVRLDRINCRYSNTVLFTAENKDLNHVIRILYITIDANHYDFYEFRAKITVLRSTVYLLRNSDYCQLGTVPHLNIIVII